MRKTVPNPLAFMFGGLNLRYVPHTVKFCKLRYRVITEIEEKKVKKKTD